MAVKRADRAGDSGAEDVLARIPVSGVSCLTEAVEIASASEKYDLCHVSA